MVAWTRSSRIEVDSQPGIGYCVRKILWKRRRHIERKEDRVNGNCVKDRACCNYRALSAIIF